MGRIATELTATPPSPTGPGEGVVSVSEDPSLGGAGQHAEALPEALRLGGGGGEGGPRKLVGTDLDRATDHLGRGQSGLAEGQSNAGNVSLQDHSEPAAAGNGTPVFDSLKPRQQQAVAAYIDPTSPTHGNGTQSWKTAYKDAESSVGASVNMSRLLNSTNGQRAVRELMDLHSLGPERRIRKLGELVHGENEQVVQTFNKDGELVRTVTSTGPQSDKLKAIDILNRMDGSYAEAEAVQSVAAEAAKQLIRANAHLLE